MATDGYQPKTKEFAKSEPWYRQSSIGFNTNYNGKTQGQIYADQYASQYKKDGTHNSDYRGTNVVDSDTSQRLFWGSKNMNTPEGAVFHPRMANQGMTNKASSTMGCHIKYQKFLMCAMNLNQRAAVAQCRQEFRDYRDCQADFTAGGAKSSKTYYQDLLKSVSRAQGDMWLDLTSRDYAKFASYSFEHRPNVGVNGNFQPGFMASERMAFDKYLGK